MMRATQALIVLGSLLGVLLVGLAWSLSANVSTLLMVCVVLVLIAFAGAWASVKRAGPAAPEALTDETAIADRLQALRKDASAFYAIWSAKYDEVEVEDYFDLEKEALAKNALLSISRVINPTVIKDKHYKLLQSIRSQFGTRYLLYEDESIQSFELYIVDYPKGRDSVAVVVVNDTLTKRPTVGLVLDPGRNPRLAGAVGAVREWFEAICKSLPVFDPVAIERWDHIAPRYTRFVTENVNDIAFLKDYTTEECKLVGECLSSLVTGGHRLSLIEVGCGDGRAVLQYVPVALAEDTAYVVGLDYSPAMIQAAEVALNRRRLTPELQLPGARALARKTSFYHLDASSMRRVFDDGRLVDLEQLQAGSLATMASEFDHATFAASQKVFCCLLNTIGVIEPPPRRAAVVEMMLAALGIDDRLVLGVFAADAFEEHAPTLYRGLAEMLDTAVTEEHFDVENATFRVDEAPGYYSQWFDEAQLLELVNAATLPLAEQGRAFHPPQITRMDSGGYLVIIRRTG